MAQLIKGHTPGSELVFRWQTTGKREWEKLYRFPEIGTGLLHFDFANPEQLGTGTGIFAFINYPVVRSNRFSLNYRIGGGAGYVSKIFTRTENYKNNATSAHLNILFNFLLEGKFRFSEKFYTTFGTGLTHFSNGAIKMPNLGINIPALYLGILWEVNRQPESIKPDSLVPAINRFTGGRKEYWTVCMAGGVRDIYPSGGTRYKGFSLSGDYNFLIRSKRTVAGGGDIFYDEYISFFALRDTLMLNGNLLSPVRAGIHISHLSMLGRLQLGVMMGGYLVDEYRFDGFFYHRLIVRYRLTNHLLLNISVKTHWAKADYLEWGVGYQFD
ncbi:MAG: acyloxyacyl hydrolase [Bacteroidetes bacterium]|nr:acyloxyacyl hydrolase [Bacteroidota bacterium]